MPPIVYSVEAFRTGMASLQMLAEAQSVIAMRMWGLAGWWSVTPAETTRMFTEKPPVLAKAATAAAATAMAGGRPDQVAAAWLAPVAGRTSANRRRLAKRGLSRP